MAEGNIYYARHEAVVVLKYEGNIRYTLDAVARLGDLLDRLFAENGISDFLVDLSGALLIDSTNLGLLAKIARHMLDRQGRKATILSTNPDIDCVLEAVGFDQVFTILHEAQFPKAPLESVGDDRGAKGDLSHMILDAHRALAALNEKNKATFKTVIECLEAETKGKSSPPHS